MGLIAGGYHDHDTLEEDFLTNVDDLIDRRALERAGWLIQDPDGLRGEPFERAIHPTFAAAAKKANPRIYPMTDDRRGEPAQIVYVPVGVATKTWANLVWAIHYPRLYRWFIDDSDFRAVSCHGVVFIKSDF